MICLVVRIDRSADKVVRDNFQSFNRPLGGSECSLLSVKHPNGIGNTVLCANSATTHL